MTISCNGISSDVTWLKIAKIMNIIDFINYFPDEESCEIYLKVHLIKMPPLKLVQKLKKLQDKTNTKYSSATTNEKQLFVEN